MTFLDLQNLVLDWLDDPNAGYFTRDKVKLWINNGQREVQKLLMKAGENWYLTCAQTTTLKNQSDYAQPADFLKVNRIVTLNNPGTDQETENILVPVTTNQTDFLSQIPAAPEAFYLKKNRIILRPSPDGLYYLRLYYSYLVADMVQDAETPDCPTQYHELCAILGAENGFIKDGRDASLLVMKKKDYQLLLQQDAQDRVQSAPRMVVTTDQY